MSARRAITASDHLVHRRMAAATGEQGYAVIAFAAGDAVTAAAGGFRFTSAQVTSI